jgi:hypothetical protein
VDGSARAVTVQLRQIKRLSHDSLRDEGRIAVHQQRQNLPAMLGVAANPLSGASLSFHDRVDSFQMARIRREPDLDFRTGGKPAHRVITQVIFHIAVAGDQFGNIIFGKLGKDNLERFAQEICQDIEPAAMRHSHANFLDASFGTFMQNRVENHHKRLRTLK